jgi:hypothetical protein
MIHFKLKHVDDVDLFGFPGKREVHWFALTDGMYWFDFGMAKVFELTDAVRKPGDAERYLEYNIARLVEDFSELFPAIGESLPPDRYQLVQTPEGLQRLYEQRIAALDEYEAIHQEDFDIDAPDYPAPADSLDWVRSRTLRSQHLKNGPQISFFRSAEEIRIVWIADAQNDNGTSIWTAGLGATAMAYAEFVDKVEEFGATFFAAMEQQVQDALAKDWGSVHIDKPAVEAEQQTRRRDFFNALKALR